MTRPDHAHIMAVVDRSGSMDKIWDDTIGGLNSFVIEQLKVKGTADFTLNVFDDEYTPVPELQGVPLHRVGTIDGSRFPPRGMTALFDAIGRSIVDLGVKLAAMPEAERPATVVVLIQTDGDENDSKEYAGPAGAARIKEMIEHQTKQDGWHFHFAGAQLNAFKVGTSLGFATANVQHYDATSAGTKGLYRDLTRATSYARGA